MVWLGSLILDVNFLGIVNVFWNILDFNGLVLFIVLFEYGEESLSL